MVISTNCLRLISCLVGNLAFHDNSLTASVNTSYSKEVVERCSIKAGFLQNR